ncbi:hypothetical protein SUSUWATARI_00220 [Serratia phage vB_SmaM-Susuwatari]|nr:hypothetical protein SUSUWATARI_00220 [Serratia phage vB_SmaM-Susuwatari]
MSKFTKVQKVEILTFALAQLEDCKDAQIVRNRVALSSFSFELCQYVFGVIGYFSDVADCRRSLTSAIKTNQMTYLADARLPDGVEVVLTKRVREGYRDEFAVCVGGARKEFFDLEQAKASYFAALSHHIDCNA